MSKEDNLGSGESRRYGYIVEARSKAHPQIINGEAIGTEWQRLSFKDDAPIGIPSSEFDRPLRDHGLYSFSVAQALRYWWHAVAELSSPWIQIESRLIKVQLIEIYALRVICAVPQSASEPTQELDQPDPLEHPIPRR